MKYLKTIINTVKKESPILFSIVLIHLFFAIIATVGLLIDERTLLGVNVWIKPLKFLISDAVFLLTSGYLITFYPYSKKKRNIINNIVSFTIFFETAIIVMQGARGVPSHYNQSSLFDGILFAMMGVLIGINVLIMLLMLIDSIRLKLRTHKSIQLGIILGWIIIIVGSWIGGQMINQMSHSVGILDGGEGLPFVNWSTIAGDLRVAHFFGLHAIQIIPLFAMITSKKMKFTMNKQILLVLFFGFLYASWIGFTFYQAKQGIPLLRL
ncbi:hypothetical protein BTO06_07365 [Tenacibaculum sp. SZ-18]|uniref:hypothetical protein n=1 Tax=Tenacibaculum sp. SZ-18 TaxID=754423 RepID=UPI000C2D1792|nr:hypothetical protein [Tenacibaculum sp. SZ-18]AUC14965.1 hypothetical protein BTO06_07365 [Tenacibaculum sp. SZ-18]